MNKFVLTAAMAATLGLTAGAAMAEHHEGGYHKGKMMERVDTDGDGQISKAEFMAKHEEQFSKVDVNGDGMLSKDEMKAARSERKEKMKERMEKREEMKESAAE